MDLEIGRAIESVKAASKTLVDNFDGNQVFRLLELPAELQLKIIDSLVLSSSIDQKNWTSSSKYRSPSPEWPISYDWTDLINLSLTCRYLHSISAPIYQRKLLVSCFTPYDHKPLRLQIDSFPRLDNVRLRSETSSLQLQQCQRLYCSHPNWLKKVTTLVYFGAERYNVDDEIIILDELESQAAQASLELVNRVPALKFFTISHTQAWIAQQMMRTRFDELTALSLCHIQSPLSNSLDSYSFLSNLKAFKLRDCHPTWMSLIPRMSKLEDLFISSNPYQIQFTDLNWFQPEEILPNLRFLKLSGFEDQENLLNKFFTTIEDYRKKALKKLMVCLKDCETLRSLYLSHIPNSTISKEIFESIATCGLVNLEKLLIMVQECQVLKWDTDLVACIESLSKLKNLRTFFHNHYDVPRGAEDVESDLIFTNQQKVKLKQSFLNQSNQIFKKFSDNNQFRLKSIVFLQIYFRDGVYGLKSRRDSNFVEEVDLKDSFSFESAWST
ncbi:expressed protein [Phakopsora pachyrhizi]|uniref:Expressed protein n=1 Tax=Phakopsora pachyrhizi TaxID=170000 RepID=A0AAV0BUR0_PHAPC|nr:expressed protein [Phakopsora pachyrhizi]